MIIGIDGNEANVGKRVGIGEYAFELLKQFSEFNPFDKLRTRIKSLKFIVYLKDKPEADMPKETESWQYRIIGPKRLWTQIGLPLDLYLHKPRPDIFFTPTHYAPRFSPIPVAISIMDLSYVYYPEMFQASDLYQLQNWTRYSVKKASRVFTISKASKNDIISIYGVPEERVIVTYPGVKFNGKHKAQKNMMQSSTFLEDTYGIKGDYILFVGTLQPRKNIERLIEAFSKIVRDQKKTKLQLVIVGKKGWLYEDILNAPRKYDVEDKVVFLDFVSDENLPLLYKNARCFILPSLYEGFGLPVLEAMQYGCPVVTSNISSLPEVGGDAVLYINPTNVEDITKKILSILDNETLRKELQSKGYRQIKKFSWEKTAKETLHILENIVPKS